MIARLISVSTDAATIATESVDWISGTSNRAFACTPIAAARFARAVRSFPPSVASWSFACASAVRVCNTSCERADANAQSRLGGGGVGLCFLDGDDLRVAQRARREIDEQGRFGLQHDILMVVLCVRFAAIARCFAASIVPARPPKSNTRYDSNGRRELCPRRRRAPSRPIRRSRSYESVIRRLAAAEAPRAIRRQREVHGRVDPDTARRARIRTPPPRLGEAHD